MLDLLDKDQYSQSSSDLKLVYLDSLRRWGLRYKLSDRRIFLIESHDDEVEFADRWEVWIIHNHPQLPHELDNSYPNMTQAIKRAGELILADS